MPHKKRNGSDINTLQVKQKMFRGSIFVAIFTIAAAPLGYLIRMVFSRSLSIEMYGLLYAMVSFFGVFITYNDLGFGYSLTFLVPRYFKKKAYHTCWLLFSYERYIEVITAVVLSASLIIFSPWLAEHYFKVPEARGVIIIFCIYFLAWSYLSAVHQFLVGLRQDAIHMSIQPLVLFLTFLFALLSYVTGHGNIYYYALSWAMAYVAGALVYTLINHFKNGYLAQGGVEWNPELLREMFKFAIPTLLTSTIFTFVTSVDTLLLTLFRGVAEVGIYNIIIPISTIPAIIFSPFEGFLFPYISHFADGEKEKISSILFTTQNLISLLTVYIGIFIALFPNLVVALLFGNKWQGLVDLPLRIYALSFIIFTLANHLNMVVSGIGRVKERLQASFGIALTNIVLGILLISQFGVMGAVITNVIINTLSLFLYFFIIKKEVLIELPLWQMVKGISLAIFFFVLKNILRIEPRTAVELIVIGFGYTALFFVLAYLLRFLTFDKKLLTDVKEIIRLKMNNKK